jgi:hypothetical protein
MGWFITSETSLSFRIAGLGKMTNYIFYGLAALIFIYFAFGFLKGMYLAYKIYKKTGQTDWKKIKKTDSKIL